VYGVLPEPVLKRMLTRPTRRRDADRSLRPERVRAPLPSMAAPAGSPRYASVAGGLGPSGQAGVSLAFMRWNSSSSMTPSALSDASFDSWSTSLEGVAAASRT